LFYDNAAKGKVSNNLEAQGVSKIMQDKGKSKIHLIEYGNS